jgi:hypothetical protein
VNEAQVLSIIKRAILHVGLAQLLFLKSLTYAKENTYELS